MKTEVMNIRRFQIKLCQKAQKAFWFNEAANIGTDLNHYGLSNTFFYLSGSGKVKIAELSPKHSIECVLNSIQCYMVLEEIKGKLVPMFATVEGTPLKYQDLISFPQ